MAILEVLRFPDERLRTIATPIDKIDKEIQTLIDDMLATMLDENGIGLAATQINVHKQLVVIDVSEEQNDPLILINPVITHMDGKTISEEGCLSVPNNYAKVERAEKITVTALDKTGKEFSLEADGLLAICIQHELDHLKGKLFVDYLSPLKRQRIKTKLEKEARLEAKG
ncbi:peptide deformylase [Paraglaciecola hydrolytica]|uniref:Peptide deformylase n=1 Tax=Paraglaciecola hydrolytica TaxID=1799789 RepID=A0A136A444_9ALTE|nr:peptide deformylase [Paraglaciecola hydrolytica]KXI30012.1 peptide deformylase [Paraglaciecola hydrolytica]